MLGRQLGEVGESLGGELLEEGHGHLRGFLRAAEGQAELLHREAVQVAVDGRDRMGCQLDGEAGPPQAADDRIVVPERCRASVQPRVHQPDGPGVPAQRVARGGGPVAHGRLPLGVRQGELDLAEHEIDHAVENLVLAGHVVVERHRLDVQPVREPAHRQRAHARLVGQGDRLGKHALPAQRGALAPAQIGTWRHERRPPLAAAPRPLTALHCRVTLCRKCTLQDKVIRRGARTADRQGQGARNTGTRLRP